MNAKERYQKWVEKLDKNSPFYKKLLEIKDDVEEIEERFYQELAFGTAGLRGKLKAGTNCMNFAVVGRATQGLANYILKQGPEAAKKGVIIAHDPRHYSKEFSQMAPRPFGRELHLDIACYCFIELVQVPCVDLAGVVVGFRDDDPVGVVLVFGRDGNLDVPDRGTVAGIALAPDRLDRVHLVRRPQVGDEPLFSARQVGMPVGVRVAVEHLVETVAGVPDGGIPREGHPVDRDLAGQGRDLFPDGIRRHTCARRNGHADLRRLGEGAEGDEIIRLRCLGNRLDGAGDVLEHGADDQGCAAASSVDTAVMPSLQRIRRSLKAFS